jgi:mRNA-degrading endonuclease RelE of RelBE toxin-antitoxin system
MPCKVSIATEVKQDILDCNASARREIGDFLLKLQDNPYPRGRRKMSEDSFYFKLPCGIFVTWEVEATEEVLLRIIFGDTEGVVLRVLGVGRARLK